jgi:hypothetical protein
MEIGGRTGEEQVTREEIIKEIKRCVSDYAINENGFYRGVQDDQAESLAVWAMEKGIELGLEESK